jgi:ABC-type glycerol-3-phosphate transport system substrate-binding protein
MNLRPFELGLIIFFGALAIGSLVILNMGNFSREPSEDSEEYVGPVQIWGTVPASAVNPVVRDIINDNELYAGVSYRFFPPEDFDRELVEALADGRGPDLLFISHEQLVEQRRRIQAVSYDGISLGLLRDTYVDGAQIFALSDGIYGTPMLVDPLMMYWNKDILTNNGFLAAPRTWEELVNVQLPTMIDRSFDRSINQAVVAMGVYGNSENAYGVLSTLLIQSGSAMVEEITRGDNAVYTVALNSNGTINGVPFVNSLSFYLRFGQPANTLYSWNRSFLSDRSEFISEDLVFYFGYGSEGQEIEELNPNLNFDIAEMPQSASADVRRTYGRFYGLAPLRSADNKPGAVKVISLFSTSEVMSQIAEGARMVPARRTLVTAGTNDLYGRLAYRSAPIAYGWLNPNLAETDAILNEAVSDVNENRSGVDAAVSNAVAKLTRLYD